MRSWAGSEGSRLRKGCVLPLALVFEGVNRRVAEEDEIESGGKEVETRGDEPETPLLGGVGVGKLCNLHSLILSLFGLIRFNQIRNTYY